MTGEEARKKLVEELKSIYPLPEAENISEIVLEKITGKTGLRRYVERDDLSAEQQSLLQQYTERLLKHEPVQYVVNEAWFAAKKFYVDKNVLIPRPETDELVDWIVKEMQQRANELFKILDIGTGSGCIAIALKLALPGAEVWACDISDEALNIARLNADTLNAAIDFIPLDFLDAEQRKQLPAVDVIVSNPPYVSFKDKSGMRKNVTDYEPSTALFVPNDDALIFYKAIAEFAKEKLHPQGKIFVEIHESLGKQVTEIFQLAGFHKTEIRKDMQDKDRMVKAEK
ncbi:MAG: peptide chain release factor N(5)-glutamine methyltransferase [Chitinophagaceae bacterium]